MKIKQLSYLIGLSMFLYGCSSTGTEKSVNHAIPVIKERGEGTHLKGLSMTRDFILDSQDDFKGVEEAFERSESKGSKKIFSVKPTGDVKPRAVILLNNKMIVKKSKEGGWFRQKWIPNVEVDLTVRRKNITLCEGFMQLPKATSKGQVDGSNSRDNEVITFMPVLGSNIYNVPTTSDRCNEIIKNHYDYESTKEELDFILSNAKAEGKSPYLAVYESETSPYSSMFLSLGELSDSAIKELSKDWPELIVKVYRHGDAIDPIIAMATVLALDPKLQKAQKDDNWKKVTIATKAAACGGVIAAGTTISLGAFLATPACTEALKEAAYQMGYDLPKFPESWKG